MTRTNRSGNEIYAAVFKAGRGAGLPTAQAERIGHVLSAIYSDAALQALLGHLATPAAPAIVHVDGQQMTIAQTHMARDFCTIDDGLSAGLTSVALAGCIDDAFCQALCDYFGWAVRAGENELVFSKGAAPGAPPPCRADVDDALWDQLNDWAFKTYVPETEQSRLSGAGAGLTDND